MFRMPLYSLHVYPIPGENNFPVIYTHEFIFLSNTVAVQRFHLI